MLSGIDFRTGSGDTDYADASSVLPVTDGEAANQTVLRRPSENLRYRTELLRERLEQFVMVNETGVSLQSGIPGATITYGGAYLYGGGTGDFWIGTDLIVQSEGTSGSNGGAYPYVASTKASRNFGTISNNQIIVTSVKKQWEGSSFPAADANGISVEVVAGTSLGVTLKGPAGWLNHIYVTIVSGTTTCQQLIDAINAAAGTLVLATLGAGSTGTNPAPLWGPPEWAGDYTQRLLKSGVAAVVHRVTPAALLAFFGASTENLLKDGDMLGIYYDKNVDTSGTGGRLQSTPENSNTVIPWTSLFNSRREPEKIPNCVPICKAFGGYYLRFVDGSIIMRDYDACLGSDSLATLYASRGLADLWACYSDEYGIKNVTKGTHGHYPAESIKEAFENVDEQVHSLWGHNMVEIHISCGQYLQPVCEFEGTSALKDAITWCYSQTNSMGCTIKCRVGWYVIDTAMTIDKRINIIGAEQSVRIAFSGAGRFTYSGAGSAGSSLENVQLRSSTNTVVLSSSGGGSGDYFRLENCTTLGASISMGGEYVVVKNCHFNDNGVNSSQLCTLGQFANVSNCSWTGSGTGCMPLSFSINSKIRDIKMTLPAGSTGVYLQDDCSAENVIIYIPFANLISHVFGTVTGGAPRKGCTVKNVLVQGWDYLPTLRHSVVDIRASNSTVENLRIVGNNATIGDFNDAVVRLAGPGLHVRGVEFSQFYVGYNTINHGLQYPAIMVYGAGNTTSVTTIEGLHVYDVKYWSTSSGDILFNLIGDEKISGTIGAANQHVNEGAVHLKDCVFDMTSFSNYYTLTSYVFGLYGLPSGSIVENCHFTTGSTGHVNAHLYIQDGHNIKIINNRFTAMYGSGADTAVLWVMNFNPSVDRQCGEVMVRGNHVYYSTYIGANWGVISVGGDNSSTDFNGAIVTDNIVRATDAAYALDSIRLRYMDRGVCRNNIASQAIAYQAGTVGANMLPASGSLGVENLMNQGAWA